MAIARFGNWVMFKHGEVCLLEEAYIFAKQENLKIKKIHREESGEGYLDWEPQTSENWFKWTLEFRQYSSNVYSIVALCTDRIGQTRMLTIWITSKSKLVDAYEFVSHNNIIPIWRELIGFIKEASV